MALKKGYAAECVCCECGILFVAGRGAKFCPKCYTLRKRDQNKASRRRCGRVARGSEKSYEEVVPDTAPVTRTRDGFWRGRPVAGGGSAIYRTKM